MTATEVVRTRLLAISAVTAIVGQRVYPLMLPQSLTQTALRVQQIGTDELMHLRGSGRMFRSRVQVDAVALLGRSGQDAYADARTLSEAVAGAGDGTGLTGWAGSITGAQVYACRPAGVREQFSGPELGYVAIMSDWIVWWRPVAP